MDIHLVMIPTESTLENHEAVFKINKCLVHLD